VRATPARALPVARFLADSRDTATLAVMATWAEGADAASGRAGPGARRTYLAPQVRAHLMAARGDTAGAVRTLLALPMTACRGAPCEGGFLSALLAASGRDRDAATVLDRWLPSATALSVPMEWLLRGRIAERQGDRAAAAAAYRRVLVLWGQGDAPARRVADEARGALTRVTR
jgi:hypothetical protein